jgi:N-glycosylase/DNA lyase
MKMEKIIKQRIKDFEKLGKEGKVTFNFKPFLDMELRATIESELLFCISTANSSAISGLRFQKFLEYKDIKKVKNLEKFLKLAKVRFFKKKAEFMEDSIKNFHYLEIILKKPSKEARKILVKNFKGIGFKEASHFLRNLGRRNVAIIDRHILKWLKREGYIDDLPLYLNSKKYEKIEKILEEISKKRGVNLAELDLWLWYEITGKILK